MDSNIYKHNKYCCLNEENKEYLFSNLLFMNFNTNNQFVGIKFLMKPCIGRKLVRELITDGGGLMTNLNDPDIEHVVILVTRNASINDNSLHKYHYFYCDYIFDCCKANQLLDLNDYRFRRKTTTIERVNLEMSDDSDDGLPSYLTIVFHDSNSENNSSYPRVLLIKPTDRTESNVDSHKIDIILDLVNTHLNNSAQFPDPTHNIDNNNNNNSNNALHITDADNGNIDINSVNTVADIDANNTVDDNSDVVEENDKPNVLSNSEKNEKQSIEMMSEKTCESDLNKTEDKSKYFLNVKLKPSQERSPQKKCVDSYMDFVRMGEMSNSENLRLIKKTLRSATSKSKANTFGSKIIEKMNKNSNKDESGEEVDFSSDDNNDNNINKIKSKPFTHNRTFSMKTKPFYEMNEDEKIVEFIIKTKRFTELMGNAFWEEAEKDGVCNGRSWQSMKERFKKYIIPNIDTLDIDEEYKEMIKNLQEREADTSRYRNEPYTEEEDITILKLIIDRNSFDNVGGKSIWITMEREFNKSHSTHRTWQGLKERYRKRIVTNLYKFKLNIELVQKILNGIKIDSFDKNLILEKCRKSVANCRPNNFKMNQKTKVRRPILIPEDKSTNPSKANTTDTDEGNNQQNKNTLKKVNQSKGNHKRRKRRKY